jgi:hypothetical protein
MNSKKLGKIFIVLMLSFVAFGFGSCANVLNSGNDVTFGLLPTGFALNNEKQMLIINDASFEPVYVIRRYTIITNNTTNVTTNVTRRTNQTNSSNTSSSRSKF